LILFKTLVLTTLHNFIFCHCFGVFYHYFLRWLGLGVLWGKEFRKWSLPTDMIVCP